MIRLASLIDRVKDIIDVGEFHYHCKSLARCSVSWNMKCILWIMNQLADHIEYLNIQDDYGNTPLLYALQLHCHNDIIVEYIERGADVNCCNFSGCSPLFYALNFYHDKEIIFKILDSGASLDVKDESGMTPLMCAIMQKNTREVILRLLYETPDINCSDKFGQTALVYALTYLVEGDEDIIFRLIDRGANTTDVDKEGNTILHKSYGSTWACISTFIFNHGISIDKRNKNGESPLFLAAKYCDHVKVQTLMALGCEPNIADKNKRTPLHVANRAVVISLIIYYGGDLTAKDSFDFTPLDLKLQNLDWENVECIIKHYLLFSKEIKIHKSLERFHGLNRLPLNRSLKKFTKELDEMKVCNIAENLSFYKFCTLKRTKQSKFVNISKSEYLYDYLAVFEKFPNFCDIILLKMEKNELEKKKYDLIKSFSQINIMTYSYFNSECGVQLNYDCFENICRYLMHNELFNLFLASL